MLRAIALGGVLALTAASDAFGQDAQTFNLPAPTGPYAVGRILEDWADENRVDPLGPDQGAKRVLPVIIWYPAQARASERTPYFPSPLLEHFPAERDHWSQVVDRAPLLKGETRLPVIIFKPAFGLLSLQYSALAEDLASHGYVVVGSDSPYTTPLVVYQDGRTAARTDKGAPRSTEDRPHELAPGERNGATLSAFAVWVADNRFVLDRLETLDAGAAPGFLAGRLDLKAVGAFGHSYGGAAALEFCRADGRCDAAVNIDGAPLGEVARAGLKSPALFVFSDRPALRASREEGPDAQRALLAAIDRIEAGLPNRLNQVIVSGAGHFNFTDPALYLDPAASRGGLGAIEPAIAISDTALLLRTFFDMHLKGHRGDAMETIVAGHPELLWE